MQIILASASPQRKELLAGLGVSFQVMPADIDEDGHPELDPASRATELARLKAQAIHADHQEAVVIGCDTLVVAADGSLLEKPKDEVEARAMLQKHSGQTSTVHSALAIIDPTGKMYEGLSSSTVTFKTLSSNEMDWWIQSGHWRDRSGAFQIDGPGQLMIEHIEGDWTSIVGLPVFLLGQLMEQAVGQHWKKSA